MKYADKNGDNKISLEEYINWCSNEQAIFNYNEEFEEIMNPLIQNLSEKLQMELITIMTNSLNGK